MFPRSIHGHLNPVEWGLDPLQIRHVAITISSLVNGECMRGREEFLYFFVIEEAKSVRERCIRVAAIDITTNAGS
jgi:hypothetical protein